MPPAMPMPLMAVKARLASRASNASSTVFQKAMAAQVAKVSANRYAKSATDEKPRWIPAAAPAATAPPRGASTVGCPRREAKSPVAAAVMAAAPM